MKNKIKDLLIPVFFLSTVLLSPVFAADSTLDPKANPPPAQKTSKCEKCYRNPEDGKIKCDPVPCSGEIPPAKDNKPVQK